MILAQICAMHNKYRRDLRRLFLQSSLLILGVNEFLFGQQQLLVQGVGLLFSLTTHKSDSVGARVTMSMSQVTLK